MSKNLKGTVNALDCCRRHAGELRSEACPAGIETATGSMDWVAPVRKPSRSWWSLLTVSPARLAILGSGGVAANAVNLANDLKDDRRDRVHHRHV